MAINYYMSVSTSSNMLASKPQYHYILQTSPLSLDFHCGIFSNSILSFGYSRKHTKRQLL